jgi:hypothetical protein
MVRDQSTVQYLAYRRSGLPETSYRAANGSAGRPSG